MPKKFLLITKIGALLLLAACAQKLTLSPTKFSAMKDWPEASAEIGSLQAFRQSCVALEKRKKPMLIAKETISVESWRNICSKAKLAKNSAEFFSTEFKPFRARNNLSGSAHFTGYHLPLLQGSLSRSERFSVPLYRLPAENLRTLTRAEINAGALAEKNLELVWVDDAVEAFFLHIQGSGEVELPDGKRILVGYAGQNGRKYKALGVYMKKQGWLPEKGISADMIKDWLRANPERAQEVMEQNPSYAYFRQLKTQQPLGAQGVELTDRHSLAVDKRFIPLGVPVFVDTSINESPKYRGEKFRKLMIAQDTGGAIKGPIRADIFFGAGEEAAERASVMNANGAMYLLLPK